MAVSQRFFRTSHNAASKKTGEAMGDFPKKAAEKTGSSVNSVLLLLQTRSDSQSGIKLKTQILWQNYLRAITLKLENSLLYLALWRNSLA